MDLKKKSLEKLMQVRISLMNGCAQTIPEFSHLVCECLYCLQNICAQHSLRPYRQELFSAALVMNFKGVIL